jgi:hypothetical protein
MQPTHLPFLCGFGTFFGWQAFILRPLVRRKWGRPRWISEEDITELNEGPRRGWGMCRKSREMETKHGGARRRRTREYISPPPTLFERFRDTVMASLIVHNRIRYSYARTIWIIVLQLYRANCGCIEFTNSWNSECLKTFGKISWMWIRFIITIQPTLLHWTTQNPWLYPYAEWELNATILVFM